jgi:glyoxylase I family protein
MNTIHHIAIICSDKEAALHFYHDLLGLPIIRENYRPERDDWKIDLKMGDCELELFIMKNHPERPSPEAYGLRHLAFKVASVDETVAELEGKGIPCEPIRTDTFTGEKMTFFHDPDGLPIEIHE